MISNRYKKIAGTCAVFVLQETQGQSPVDREGLVWTSAELHVADLPLDRKSKPSMPNTLSLEGLEEYDKPENGDTRAVESLGCQFVYLERTHSWIQVGL